MTKKTVKSVCSYCGSGYGIVIEIADNKITKVTDDKLNPVFSKSSRKTPMHSASNDLGVSEIMARAFGRPWLSADDCSQGSMSGPVERVPALLPRFYGRGRRVVSGLPIIFAIKPFAFAKRPDAELSKAKAETP